MPEGASRQAGMQTHGYTPLRMAEGGIVDRERALREHVVYVLRGGGAHIGVEEAVGDWPERLRGVKPAGAAHTAWQLIEHMRIAQWDILEFSRGPKHVSPNGPPDIGRSIGKMNAVFPSLANSEWRSGLTERFGVPGDAH